MSTTFGAANHPIVNAFSGTTSVTSTAKRLLADIRELAPDISSRAAEIEARAGSRSIWWKR
jgi:hypothetical protein